MPLLRMALTNKARLWSSLGGHEEGGGGVDRVANAVVPWHLAEPPLRDGLCGSSILLGEVPLFLTNLVGMRQRRGDRDDGVRVGCPCHASIRCEYAIGGCGRRLGGSVHRMRSVFSGLEIRRCNLPSGLSSCGVDQSSRRSRLV